MSSLRLVVVPDPAAGANFIYTQPASLTSLLLCLRFRLIDDDNAGLRTVNVGAFEPGGLLMSILYWNQPVMMDETDAFLVCGQATQTISYSPVGFAPARYYWRQSPTFVLLPNWTLTSLIGGIQVGDQISSLSLLFEDIPLVAPGVVG